MLVGGGGCSKSPLDATRADDGGGVDAGTLSDPAACGCQLDSQSHTLTMSWDCYCKVYDCTKPMITACVGDDDQWTRGCGLSEYSRFTVGGPERWAYDQSGKLVGAQQASDVPNSYSCPSDPSMLGDVVRSGQLLDTCNSATVCTCQAGDAGTGACTPTDAGF